MILLTSNSSKSTNFPDLQPSVDLIKAIQRSDGSIPWFEDGIWDAWNHVECAMALEVAGETTAADAAFDYLRTTQNSNGSWQGEYGNTAEIIDEYYMSRETAGTFEDTNFTAYCATGIWHRFLSRSDLADLEVFWPMVRNAMYFVLNLQSDHGDVAWSSEAIAFGPDDSVRAGNASIRKSLECATRIAFQMGAFSDARTFRHAMRRIDHAFLHHPERFDRKDDDRSRYAMDWYYPSMCGVLKGHDATLHIRQGWNEFVDPEKGCHCVLSEPWITVAESAELAIALAGLGARDIARQILKLQLNHRDSDGCFWMGYQYEEDIFWPREKPSWTQAAMILAIETLRRGSPTSVLLGQHY